MSGRAYRAPAAKTPSISEDVNRAVRPSFPVRTKRIYAQGSGISLQRPFRRLRASTARPPGTLIRARKPIVRARLRLFGLYVGSMVRL